MKLSCADFTFPLLPRRDAWQLIRLLGFAGVDLGVFPGRGHIQPQEIANNTAGVAKRTRDALKDNQLATTDVFVQLQDANHPDAPVRASNRELFKYVRDFCAELG